MNIIEWRNALCQDDTVSPRGKHIGLTLSLFYRPGKRTYPTIDTLCEWSSTTFNTVSSAIKDLIKAGYIEKKPFRFPNAKFQGTEYAFCGVSGCNIEEKDERPSNFDGAIDGAIQPSNFDDKEEEKNNKNNRAERLPTTPNKEFELFWQEYPRKEDKKKAITIFAKLLKQGIDHEEIIRGATEYKLHCRANNTLRKYIKLPTSWLNAGSWENEYKDSQEREQPERTDLVDWREEKKRREELYGTI